MKIKTETKKPFATFSLRGGRLHKRGRSVVSHAPFLMGAASAVVLGSMLALSTSAFAQDGGGVASTAVTTTTKIIAENGALIASKTDVDSNGAPAFPPDTDATDHNTIVNEVPDHLDTSITTSGTSVSTAGDYEYYSGVYVYRQGRGDITLINGASITGMYSGVDVSFSSGGDLAITNNGRIMHAVKNGIYADLSGNGAMSITNSSMGGVGSDWRGIHARRTGTGSTSVDNASQITAGEDAIHIRNTGTGGVTSISNSSRITATGAGIDVEHDNRHAVGADINVDLQTGSDIGSGGIGVVVHHKGGGSGNISISGRGTVRSSSEQGIFAEHLGTGNVTVDLHSGSSITGDKAGVWVARKSTEGTGEIRVNVLDGSSLRGNQGEGIYAGHTRTNGGLIDIDVAGSGTVSSVHRSAIKTINKGSSNTAIDINGTGTVSGGIDARHTGGEGSIDISIKGSKTVSTPHRGTDSMRHIRNAIHMSNTGEGSGTLHARIETSGEVVSVNGDAVFAEHTGNGDIHFDLHDGTVSSGQGHAMFATHDGGGRLLVNVFSDGAISSGPGNAINVTHTGSRDINVNIRGQIASGSGDAIVASHSGTHNAYVRVLEGAMVSSSEGNAVDVSGAGSNTIVVEVFNGRTVSSGQSHAIVATHTGTGNEKKGAIRIDIDGIVSSGDGDDAINMDSAGTKTLILRPGFSLVEADGSSGKAVSKGSGKGILKLSERRGYSASGSVDLSNFHNFERFIKDDESEWTVTGISESQFEVARVSAGTLLFSEAHFKMSPTTSRRFFNLDDADMEIVGSNTLTGNLINNGKISFKSSANDTLRVTGNYKGTGGVVFDIGSGGWDEDQLMIEGNILRGVFERNVTLEELRTPMSPPLADESPSLIVLVGSEEDGHFGGDARVGSFSYNLVHRFRNNRNEWYFKKAGMMSSSPVRAMADPVRLLGPVLSEEPVGNLELWDDVDEYAGGPWAEQQSSRTLLEQGTAGESSRLRGQNNRVHFGFDLPSAGLMGGDVVVGASVWQGASISDISSQDNTGSIGVESHAAALSASWRSSSGFYADGGASYIRFSSDVSENGRVLVRDNEGTGVSASAEAGYRLAVPLGGMDFRVAPQMQMVWSHVGFDDFVNSYGEFVSLEDGDLATGRLGLSWDGEWRDIGGFGRIYGGMNLRSALDGRTVLHVSGTSLVEEQRSLSIDGRLGVSYEWDDGYVVHGEAMASSGDDAEEVRANLGVRIEF